MIKNRQPNHKRKNAKNSSLSKSDTSTGSLKGQSNHVVSHVTVLLQVWPNDRGLHLFPPFMKKKHVHIIEVNKRMHSKFTYVINLLKLQ